MQQRDRYSTPPSQEVIDPAMRNLKQLRAKGMTHLGTPTGKHWTTYSYIDHLYHNEPTEADQGLTEDRQAVLAYLDKNGPTRKSVLTKKTGAGDAVAGPALLKALETAGQVEEEDSCLQLTEYGRKALQRGRGEATS